MSFVLRHAIVYFIWAPDKGKFCGEVVYIAPIAA
jgi:hypothetical protein